MQYGVNFFKKLAIICHELKDEIKKNPNPRLNIRKTEIIPFLEVKNLNLEEFIEVCCQNVCLLSLYKKLYPNSNSNFTLSNKFLEQFWSIFFANRNEITINFHKKLNNLQFHKEENNISQFESISNFIQSIYTQFIKKYDSKFQKKRGITYTPDFIINAIIKSIDSLLKIQFKNISGITSNDLIFYDPATGSLSFEIGLISYVYSIFKEKDEIYDNEFINWMQNTFNRSFLGNELNAPAYFLGKFLLFDVIYQKGLTFQEKNNINEIFKISFKSALSSDTLEKIKSLNPELTKNLIIFGNPPYAVSSSNKDSWIYDLMREYAVKEPNLTRLYDDYVKFFRMSQWLINHQKKGILAFITNRKYLDGKIFYGMRKSMLESFDTIYIIDLFGDIRNVKEFGQKTNTNIFNIQTGVCIGFFIKKNEKNRKNKKKSNKMARIFYFGIKGSIEQIKLQMTKTFDDYPFIELYPQSPKFYFIPVKLKTELIKIWNNQCVPITDCFQKTSRAMISSRDHFMIHVDEKPLKENINLLRNRDFVKLRNNRRIGQKFDEILENEKLLSSFNFSEMESSIIPLNYRPFDIRHGIFYTINRKCGKSIILDYLNKPNLNFQPKIIGNDNTLGDINSGYAFNFVQSIQHPPFNHFLFTKGVVDSGLFGYSTSKVAPLWINGKSNLSPKFISMIQNIAPQSNSVQIFGYIYAILNCDLFTKKFEPILIHEFPRVLMPFNLKFFDKMSDLGLKLMHLHTYELFSEQWNNYQNFKNEISLFPDKNELNSWIFKSKEEQLILLFGRKSEQKLHEFLLQCPKKVWEYNIGSIKLIEHWLNSRKFKYLKRSMNQEEINNVIFLLFSINETIKIKSQIDSKFSESWEFF